MRKSAAIVPLSLLAATLTTLPAHAADGVVTIGWADATHKAVRVSWPTDDKADDVQVMLHGVSAHTVTVDAAAPETVDIPISAFPKNERLRIDVRAVTTPFTTLVGSSAVFDTDVRFDGFIQKHQPNANGTLGLTWIYTGTQDDAADPLDLPIMHVGGPVVSTPTGCDWQQVATVTGSPASTSLANRPRPHQLRIRSNEEWGNLDGEMVWEADDQVVTPSFPAVANFNQTVTLKGKLELIRPGACAAGKPRPTYRSVLGNSYLTLQGRASSTAPWVQVAGTIYTNPKNGQFEIQVPARGTRQYRIFAPGITEAPGFYNVVAFQTVSGASTVTTRYQLNSAKFADTTVAPGKPAVAQINVAPANNIRTTLEKWNGKAWVGVKWVYLGKGVGQYTFPAPAAGNHSYRFVVPPTTYNGLPVAGITTPTMTLVVR